MDVSISGRNVDVPEEVQDAVRSKIGTLDRFVYALDRADVVFREEKNPRISDKEQIEVTLQGHGHHIAFLSRRNDFGCEVCDFGWPRLPRKSHDLHRVFVKTSAYGSCQRAVGGYSVRCKQHPPQQLLSQPIPGRIITDECPISANQPDFAIALPRQERSGADPDQTSIDRPQRPNHGRAAVILDLHNARWQVPCDFSACVRVGHACQPSVDRNPGQSRFGHRSTLGQSPQPGIQR